MGLPDLGVLLFPLLPVLELVSSLKSSECLETFTFGIPSIVFFYNPLLQTFLAEKPTPTATHTATHTATATPTLLCL